MDLYNEEIDEFVDWVSGEDVISKRDRTGFKLVSGGKIRELLLNRLRNPITFIEDAEAGLYRVFSSEKAYRRWLSDPVEYSKLELFTFARPSAYKITAAGLLSETRYMAKTNSSQEESKLKYTWSIGNEEDPNYVDTLRVTYRIEKGDGNTVSYVLVYNNNNKSVEEDIYDYLTSGVNTVTVTMKGSSSGAAAGFVITIIVLDLLVTSNFDFSRPLLNGELLFSRNQEYIFISRNDTSINTSVYIYVDGQLCTKKDLNEKDNLIWVEIRNNWQAGYHDLLIYAESRYNKSTFLSNVLYYKFVNSSEPYLDYFIPLGTSLYGGIPPYALLQLSATQFEKFSLDWGYYTNAVQTDTAIPITWKLIDGEDVITLTTHLAQKGQQSESLEFIPSIYSKESQIYLAAYYKEFQITKIPINITKGSSDIIETPSYDLKLNAYGKTNNSSVKDLWEFLNENGERITTSFYGISWDESSGWYENSLRVNGQSQYAVINYNPFKGSPENGRTIEIEFESENVENTSDIIIRIGSENSRIDITPNSASLYDSNGTRRIYTNFKANERVKLAFIINGEARSPGGQILPENKLAYIINNGILERGADVNGILFGAPSGTITIGKSTSGVRVYSIRTYLRAITYLDAYDNFVFDSDDKTSIINRNAVIKNGNIDYDLCYNKLDTILIKGNISNLLNKSSSKESSECNVDIIRHNPFDVTGASDFSVEGAKIRKHGQSTLNYPVPSMKFWLNKKWHSDELPTLNWEEGKTLGLAKNRYIMKNGAIPANKFVLQANYADSSGVHNGAILRIIQLSWFDAEFGSNKEHKLRTDPQLFTTNETVTLTDNTVIGKNSLGYTWDHYNNSKFPYQIRISPDSFPCVVFYLLDGSDKKIFLGLYVFMDDKKSDYLYGERSIYRFASDPFCLTEDYRKLDTSDNKVWDNKNVLRIEVLTINTVLSSFNVNTRTTDIELKIISNTDTDSQDSGTEKFRWEEDFELIYPDEDDIKEEAGNNKFSENSKFRAKTKPFVDWLKWLSDTKYNWNKTVSGGSEKTSWGWNAGQYSSAQQCFEATAPSHLDLYKLAAYYIFFLRLGLVDSVERNAQLKTYDGLHWHYESWDMDIALGNKNTGGIAFDPPIDRNSRFIDTNSGNEGVSYAFGGRGADKNTGEVITSNWLWDALEGWGWWKGVVVRETAEALSKAGLNYNTLTNFFDKEYANKWCELIYNENGYFKYILLRAGDNTWLDWLLGSRATHRHWWLNSSMSYYDSYWKVGDFREHKIYIAADYVGDPNTHDSILVRPRASTFFELTQNDEKNFLAMDSSGNTTDGRATRDNPVLFDLTGESFDKKVPLYLYGATYVEELDLSCFARGLDGLELGGSYSEVEGAPIKVLNIGTKLISEGDSNHYSSKINVDYAISIRTGTSSEDVDIYQLGYDSLLNVQTLNMRGQNVSKFNLATLFRDYDRSQLKNFYAMGSTFENFYSSKTGNQYNDLELPGINKLLNGNNYSSFTYLNLNNSSWNNLTFWNGVINGNSISLEKCNINGDYSLGIPTSLKQVVFTGTTCTHEESKEFILNWIDCIIASEGVEAIKSKLLELNNINWRGLTYSDVEHLAMFNGGDNRDGKNLSGYIVLRGGELTVEQLTQLKIWFGDSVFTPNSRGLVVDLESDYVRINIGGDDIELKTVDDGLGHVTNEIYLTEGGSATLNATKFQLAELAGNYNWSVRLPGTSIGGMVYKSCNIGVGADGITRLYTRQSIEGNYDVDVVCVSVDGSGAAPLNSTVRIHIITATYPEGWEFDYSEVENTSNIRLAGNNLNFYAAGVTTEIYVEPLGLFTAGITDVKFSLTKLENGETKTLIDRVSCNEFKGDNPTPMDLPDEPYLVYTKLSLKKYGITLAAKGVEYGDNNYYYTLTATAVYKSNSTESVSILIMVSDDSIVLVDVNKYGLIEVISNAYLSITHTNPRESKYYKSELMTISGELDFSMNQSTQTTSSFLTYKNDSVFKYLPGVTSLILDGCSYLKITDDNIEEENKKILRFDKMPLVTNLSMLECFSLSGLLDLSNSNLKTIKIGGTNQLSEINVPESMTSLSLIDNTTDSPNLIGVAYNSGLFEKSLINKLTIEESLEKKDLSFENHTNLSWFTNKVELTDIVNDNISGYLYSNSAYCSSYLILRKYLKNVKLEATSWMDPYYTTNYILESLFNSSEPLLCGQKFLKYEGTIYTSNIKHDKRYSSNSTGIIFLNRVVSWLSTFKSYPIGGKFLIYAPNLSYIYSSSSSNSSGTMFYAYTFNYANSWGYSEDNQTWAMNVALFYSKKLSGDIYIFGSINYPITTFVLDNTSNVVSFVTRYGQDIVDITETGNNYTQYYAPKIKLYVTPNLMSTYTTKYPGVEVKSLYTLNRVATYEDWVAAGQPALTLIEEFMTTY